MSKMKVSLLPKDVGQALSWAADPATPWNKIMNHKPRGTAASSLQHMLGWRWLEQPIPQPVHARWKQVPEPTHRCYSMNTVRKLQRLTSNILCDWAPGMNSRSLQISPKCGKHRDNTGTERRHKKSMSSGGQRDPSWRPIRATSHRVTPGSSCNLSVPQSPHAQCLVLIYLQK